jgi:hypothetical protein
MRSGRYGQNIDEVYVKSFITGANIMLLDLLDIFGPHGTAVKILAEAVQRGFGGLWVVGHASVGNGTLQVRGGRSDPVVFGRHTDYAISLAGSLVSVRKTTMGGLLPSSRLITIEQHGQEVRMSTPNGHGDRLGAAIQSWA